jgi:hypothetical protein
MMALMIAHDRGRDNRIETPNAKPARAVRAAGLLLLVALAWGADTGRAITLTWNAAAASGVAGYRLYQGTASRVYTQALGVGNTTSASVAGLSDGATYYFAVAAVATTGLEGPYSSELVYQVPVSNPPPVLMISGLSFAAASGAITAPFVVANGVISQPVETGLTNGGRSAYTFTAPTTGDYVISALVNAPNSGAHSFYVNFDAEPTDPTMIWDIPITAGFTNQWVAWRGNGAPEQDQFAPKVFNLAQGTHQLIVRGREANTQLAALTIVPAPAAATLPAPWQTIDISDPGLTGSASAAGGLYTVAGAGAISGSADTFRFLYQPISGDCEIRAQINSAQNTGAAGSIGVMLRETLTAGSPYSFVGMSADGNLRWQRRDATGSATVATTSSAVTPPNFWVRVVRSGSTITRYQSTDGLNWNSIYAYTSSMVANAYLGLAVCSGSSSALNTATFDQVTLIP